jgi:hypothetical protein
MKNERIARVFPRRTVATPSDELAFVDVPPMMGMPEFDEVHVSVAFTYDMPKAEELAYQWESVGVPVKMGGPAYNERGGDFVPGLYLKDGYVITSRGCPNRCWFCSVPKREGYMLRELPIVNGWNILDDNLLACSEQHIRDVFAMLDRQKHRPVFTGGLEAKILKPWHVDLLRGARTERLYMAYDTPDDFEPLVEAGKMLRAGGFTAASHVASAYVLVGYRGDTFEKAEKRLIETIEAGFQPYAMLFRNENGVIDDAWKPFQREWCRPIIVGQKFGEIWNKRREKYHDFIGIAESARRKNQDRC